MIGKTISHYKILEKLGEGGMGVVYKAEDTKLKRHVALKFLPPDLTRDANARERFIQEAQAASALDHSNICTIYEVNQTDDGQMYISMACYTGETLKEKIAKGSLTIDETVNIATQIAEGLSKAHKKEIVHRDIKPANIFVTEEGEVKIVDFGLAKLAGQARLTKTGTTVGTVAYMSPEQARGEDVDNRTDVWSLGAVLYEMITGRPPFRGDHEQAVIYSIVNHEPEAIDRLRPDVPVALERIVAKTMEKDRNRRYRDLSEFIGELKGTVAQPAVTRRPRGAWSRTTMFFPYIVVAVAFVLILFSLTKIFRPEQRQHRPPSYRQVTFSGQVRYPALSSDGKYVAWSDRKDNTSFGVWVKDLETGTEINVFTAPRCWVNRWSPDGSRLMVSALYGDTLGGTFIIPRLGGEPRKIIDSPWPYTAWSPDGAQIAYVMVDTREINIFDLGTGETRKLTLESGLGDVAELDWSAAHDKLLFQADDTKYQTIWAMRPDGTGRNLLLRTEYDPSSLIATPRWSPKGDAVYFFKSSVRGQSVVDLMKIPVDPATAAPVGGPVLVLSGLLSDAGSLSITDDGTQLLYTQQTMYANLWLVTVEGEEGSFDVKKTQLTTGTTWKSPAEISPDGNHCVFAMSSGEASNVYVMRLPEKADGPETTESPRQLTFFNSTCDAPVWSPDGKEIAFYSTQGGVPKVWHMKSSGGTPKPFDNAEFEPWAADDIAWAPGRTLIHRTVGVRGFSLLDPVNGTQSTLVGADTLGYIFHPVWSPGGKRVAFFWNRERARPPSMGVWIKDMTDGSMWKIADGAVYPLAWTPDGMYVWGLRYSVRAGPLGNVFKVPVTGGEPIPWVDLPFERVDADGVSMTPDGRKYVYSKAERHADAWIVENFDPDVK
ncbi:MAG: serine/threonine-protein kinase [Candidatus Latescibacterota bacterium]|nr:MAG: serine/threonine-protein kinase [Candidatus Latescibacterota bacterium]